MELGILILKDALDQQIEQLHQAKITLTKNPDKKQFIQRGIDNLIECIADLEKGIKVLRLAGEQEKALSIQSVSISINLKNNNYGKPD